jgi:hypothetical protein
MNGTITANAAPIIMSLSLGLGLLMERTELFERGIIAKLLLKFEIIY